MVKSILQDIYNGFFRFIPLKKYFKKKSNHRGNFPKVGFLNNEKKDELENVLGVLIKTPEIFEQALVHRSYLQIVEEKECLSNERLEFLGDSVLGMIIAEYLFFLHSDISEGELTKLRARLVNKGSLALCAKRLGLDKFIMLSFSAEKSLKGGSYSILADAMESVIAAIYIDLGMETAKNFIHNSMVPVLLNNEILSDRNYKSIFLETVQADGLPSPVYSLIEEHGPDHDKEFTVKVCVDGKEYGRGIGKSKKSAEQQAAKEGIENYDVFCDNYTKIGEI